VNLVKRSKIVSLSYYVITSNVGDKINTEGFFIDQEMEIALDILEETAIKYFDQNYMPIEDGTIGYYFGNDRIYLEEKSIRGNL